jgi:hypothetical protein
MRNNTGSNAYSRIHHRGDGPLQIYTENNSPVTFYTANTHRMTISSGGDVGIGTASPTYPLQVTGSEASNYVARFENTNPSTPHGIAVIVADNGDPVAFVGCKTQAEHLGGLYANTSGDIYLSGTSDARVKNSIADTEVNAIELIQKLRVRDFFYNNRSALSKTTGFIAQEVLEVLPEMVIYDRDKDLYMVAREFLVPYLTKAVQEQQQIIDDQNIRIDNQNLHMEQLRFMNQQTLDELQSLKAEVETLRAMIAGSR